MKDDVRAKGEYEGVKFHVNHHWRFVVPSLEKRYDDYDQMKDAIERSQKAKSTVQKRKLDIPVITKEGKEHRITGVHAGTGRTLFRPPEEDRYYGGYYPDVDWIRFAIAERQNYMKLIDEIDNILCGFCVHTSDSTYHFDVSKYPEEVAAVEKSADEVRQKAMATDFKTELEKVRAKKKRS